MIKSYFYLPRAIVLFSVLLAVASESELLGQEATVSPIVKSQLNVLRTDIQRASFPVVDVHTHFFVKAKHSQELLRDYVAMMDRNQIAVSISLDGTLLTRLDEHCKYLWTEYQDRFVVFANLDFQGEGQSNQPETWACNRTDFVRNTVEGLKSAHRKGLISGLKLFKDFGLRYRNADGSLIAIDDPRWDPIWTVCNELGLPVIMHTADPGAFFEPITPTNERYFELQVHPDWSFAGSEFPARSELHAARNRVFARHPKTQFIAAHFGNDAEDLEELGTWLDRFPNLWIEFASRINELGRQPYSARRFFEKYQDRILFGTDGPWPESRLRIYWRFLETSDEYFEYSEKQPPPQGNWRIYGLGLPKDVLEKIYHLNAARLIPQLQDKVSKFQKANVGR